MAAGAKRHLQRTFGVEPIDLQPGVCWRITGNGMEPTVRFIVGTHRFWPRPALVVPSCIGLALLAIGYDHAAARSDPDSGSWGYPGGGEGARSLLSAVASSSIGVAGTISSATLAPRSLATPTSPSRRHGQGAETRLGWEDGEKRYGAFTASTRA